MRQTPIQYRIEQVVTNGIGYKERSLSYIQDSPKFNLAFMELRTKKDRLALEFITKKIATGCGARLFGNKTK